MRARSRCKRLLLRSLAMCLLLALFVGGFTVAAAQSGIQTPDVSSGTDADVFPFNLLTDFLETQGVEGASTTVELILLLTILTLVPSILVMMTSFTRIVIILSFTRNAMGTQQTPPNQVIVGLALFLTFFTMYGPLSEIMSSAWAPYKAEEITVDQAFDRAVNPLRQFMFDQIRLQNNTPDLRNFLILAKRDMPAESLDEIPTHVLIPAFITSEIKTAFRIGFYIFIPFIVIDMVVASALMSMGMMMLPPVMISLPFKIMLFVLVDGWNLVVTSIIRGFGG